MQIHQEKQIAPVADEVLALTACVRPILSGVLYSLKADVVHECGGYENVKLKLLPRLRREHDGDCGVCFEYAVHDAMSRGDQRVLDRIATAAKLCRIPSGVGNPTSLLFGLEKTGSQQLIDTVNEALTDDSRLLYGTQGQPAKLRKHLDKIAGAFRNSRTRPALPYSIRGLWKADLFLGYRDTDRWVGTSVKINPSHLEGAAGLRIGIVPMRQGRTDRVRQDEGKNLIICPLPHDQDFMETFYVGWRIVQAFLDADAKVPKESVLPRPIDREVAKILAERREFPVLEVIDALKVFGQPGLLETKGKSVDLQSLKGEAVTELMVAPISLNVS